MSFGFRSTLPSGEIQIDSGFVALREVQRGVAPQAMPNPGSSSQVVLVRPKTVTGKVGIGYPEMEWVVLQPSNTVSHSTDFGLAIYKEDGSAVYDSGDRIMVPRGNGIFAGNLGSPREKVLPLAQPYPGRKRYIEWSFLRRIYGIAANVEWPSGAPVVATADFNGDGGVSVGLEVGPIGAAPRLDALPTYVNIKFIVADL